MNPQELRQKCEKAIAHPILGGANAKIKLHLKGTWGTKNTKRLWKGGPIGEIIADGFPDGIFVVFSATEILTQLDDMGV